jgi:phosphate transport system substrate-binding protein
MRFTSILCVAAVAALALVHAAPVSAATGKNPVYGTGGSLSYFVYRDLFNCVGEAGARVPHSADDVFGFDTCAPGSETAPVSGVGVMEILYAAIGTGSAQNDYLTNTTAFGATPFNTGVVFGLAGYLIGGYQDPFSGYSYAYAALHFAAGSAPLSAAQLAQTSISGQPVVVGMGNVTGPAIQVPSLVTAVAVAFHDGGTGDLDGLFGLPVPTDAQGTRGTSGLVLTTEQLCGIFNGDITDWSDSRLTQSNGKTPSLAPKGIMVVYRHESAGTTFLTSNALITQCAGTSHPMDPAWGPASLSYFLNASPQPATWVDENTLNTRDGFVQNGDDGMADAIRNHDGAIGYISSSFAEPYGTPLSNPSPTANLVNSSGTVVPPTPYSASLIVAGLPAPNPGDDATTWGIKGLAPPQPTNKFAFPIGGFSWVYLYTCYANQTDFFDIASGSQPGVWGWYFDEAGQADVTAILKHHGFARIPNNWLRAVRNLLFSDPTTKIRVGPSAGVCTGGA